MSEKDITLLQQDLADLELAFSKKNMAIVECEENGETCYVLCALLADEVRKDFNMVPFAKLLFQEELNSIMPNVGNQAGAVRVVQQEMEQLWRNQTGTEPPSEEEMAEADRQFLSENLNVN